MNRSNRFATNVFGILVAAGFAMVSNNAMASCPNIEHAINNLQKAQTDLQNAKKDFGGHRKDALDAVNTALQQLGLALQSEQCK